MGLSQTGLGVPLSLGGLHNEPRPPITGVPDKSLWVLIPILLLLLSLFRKERFSRSSLFRGEYLAGRQMIWLLVSRAATFLLCRHDVMFWLIASKATTPRRFGLPRPRGFGTVVLHLFLRTVIYRVSIPANSIDVKCGAPDLDRHL